MNEEDMPIIEPKTLLGWVKKNYLTVLGIIIISSIALYDQWAIDSKVNVIADKCNAFWHKQINQSCPMLLEQGYRPTPKIQTLEYISLVNTTLT